MMSAAYLSKIGCKFILVESRSQHAGRLDVDKRYRTGFTNARLVRRRWRNLAPSQK
jgi:hypothetical protein